MTIHSPSTGEQSTPAGMTHADLMLAMLVERFAVPVPEWKPPADPDPLASYEAYRDAYALRLIVDNSEQPTGRAG